MSTPPQKNFNAIPLLLFIFSFLLRINLISIGPYHVDCLNLAIQAEKTFQTQQLHHLFGFGYPLTVLCGAIFVFITHLFSINDPVFAVNLMSVFFSSLCIPLMYLSGKKLFNSLTGLFSALLLNVSPTFLGLSIYGTSHTPCLCFLLLGIYLLLCHLENEKIASGDNLFDFPPQPSLKYLGEVGTVPASPKSFEGKRGPPFRKLYNFLKGKKLLPFYLSSISIGFMGACRMQDFILMLIPISSLFVLNPKSDGSTYPNKFRMKYFLVFWGIVFFTAALLHLPLWLGQYLSSYKGQFVDFIKQGIGPNFRGIISPSLFRSAVFLNFNLFPIGILISFVGLFQIFKRNPRLFLFLILWIITPLIFYGNLHSTAPRFLVISTLPLLFAMGYFFSSMSMSLKNHINKFVFILFFFLEFLMFASIYPVIRLRHDHALIVDFVKWISQKTEKSAFIIAGDENFFIQHYTTRRILYKPTSAFAFKEEELPNFQRRLDQILSENTPIYIDTNGLYSYDANHQFSNLIKNNYQLESIGKHLIEEWYPGEIFDDIQWHELFRISKK